MFAIGSKAGVMNGWNTDIHSWRLRILTVLGSIKSSLYIIHAGSNHQALAHLLLSQTLEGWQAIQCYMQLGRISFHAQGFYPTGNTGLDIAQSHQLVKGGFGIGKWRRNFD